MWSQCRRLLITFSWLMAASTPVPYQWVYGPHTSGCVFYYPYPPSSSFASSLGGTMIVKLVFFFLIFQVFLFLFGLFLTCCYSENVCWSALFPKVITEYIFITPKQLFLVGFIEVF